MYSIGFSTCNRGIKLKLATYNYEYCYNFRQFFQVSPISWIRFIGGERVGMVGGGGRWGAEGRFSMHLNRKARLLKYRQPQFTFQAGTVADSSLTPSVALLVRPSGTTYSTVDCQESTGSQK